MGLRRRCLLSCARQNLLAKYLSSLICILSIKRRLKISTLQLGLEDPYYSVLTDPRWRGHAEADLIEDFYSTGAGDLQRLESWLARNRVYVNWDGLCAEYGCGVGRFTEWLAKKFNSVLALDVSASHLDLATRRAEGKQILKRVKYVRVTGPADLAMLTGIDLFYSVIVLQHNPPPIILAILAAAFSGLNDGGIAFFQVPTRGHEGYNFNVQEYLERNESHGIEMHAVDQSAIFSLAHRYGLRALEVSRDHCTGPLGISTTFLMRKVDKA